MCVAGCKETVVPKLNRRNFLMGAGAAALAAAAPVRVQAAAKPGIRKLAYRRLVDLTHTFRSGFPVYAFDNPTRETLVTVPANGFYAQEWTFGEHSGTHMDAPGHFVADGRLTPAITLDELVAPLVVIDIRDRVAADPDALVTAADVWAWERRHGRIPRGACVAMYSGWEQYVGDQDAYRGTDASGVYHFPGFGLDAVDFLLQERDIHGIAVDTLSLDHGPSTTFDVHVRLLGADRWGLENLANLGQMPARGSHIVVGLIPWEEGSGGPCRVMGLAR